MVKYRIQKSEAGSQKKDRWEDGKPGSREAKRNTEPRAPAGQTERSDSLFILNSGFWLLTSGFLFNVKPNIYEYKIPN